MLRHALLFALVIATQPVWAGLTTISDTQPIIDFPLCRCGKPLPAVLDFALFDFSTQPELCGLDRIELTFTMEDGDTAPGQFDYNSLSLALDDIDTGIKLNGFGTDAEPTLTLSLDRNGSNWLSDSTVEQILDKLNEDGQLFASIIDATPDDNNVNLYSAFDTTLRLTGNVCVDPNPVPEPGAMAAWVITAGGLAYAIGRRKKNAAA